MAVVFIVYILISVIVVTCLVVRHRKLEEQLNEARYIIIKNCVTHSMHVYIGMHADTVHPTS